MRATLPFVGVQTWLDWLAVGKEAADLYKVNQNWINLSRDLQSVPRRILHDFNRAEAERDTPLAKTLAWTLWSVVFVTTVSVYLRFADHRRATGIGAGFLFFGAWLTCYHFMYYDARSPLGRAVLFAEPTRFLRTRLFGLSTIAQPPPPGATRALDLPRAAPMGLGARTVGYVCSFPLTILLLLLLLKLAQRHGPRRDNRLRLLHKNHDGNERRHRSGGAACGRGYIIELSVGDFSDPRTLGMVRLATHSRHGTKSGSIAD